MEYRDLLRQWPVGPEGQPEPPALLTVADDSPGGRDICRSLLASFGIPHFTARPGAGEAASVYTGRSPTGIGIYVPASRLNEAEELLNTPVTFTEKEYEEET